MTSRIDIIAPATITVLPGVTSSLDIIPPDGISITDPNSAPITITLAASNFGAAFSVSSIGGATITGSGATITITGVQAQVNTALASLTIAELPGAPSDTISLNATDGSLRTSTNIAVNIGGTIGPAFAAPPATISLSPYALTSIPGLVLGDPEVTALNAAGLGHTETLALTLSAASGILFLPSLSPLSGVQARGIGTSEILLTFTADQLTAINALLASLAYAAPAATSGLAYGMRDVSGPFSGESTSGNIVLNITGTQGAPGSVTSGADTAILGPVSLAGTLTIANTTAGLGGLTAGGVVLLPDAALELPYNTLSLSGTSFDFGTLAAAALFESGTLIIAGGATIGGQLSLGTTGFIDFTGNLIAAATAQSLNQPGISLAPGAIITGSGTLVAGNFSESGFFSGPGTILAGGGDTILLAAGEVSGTALDIATGGVLILGALDPLYGVFNATPLTIDRSTTLAFLNNSGDFPITGGFADSLAQAGGAIVIASPDLFAGTITGFSPGDRLIFPGLTGLTLLSITSHSFVVAGQDRNNVTQSYTINAAYPAGAAPFVMTDASGDSEVALRDTATDVLIDNVTASSNVIFAAQAVPQPILGLDFLVRGWTTQSLTITLSVGHGTLADGNFAPAATLTITAASPTALNSALAGLIYTNAGGLADTLTIASATGLLAGLSDVTPIQMSSPGTVGGFGDAGQVASFPAAGINPPLNEAAAPGEIDVTGAENFAGSLVVEGISGTALVVDAGGTAIFDAAANAAFNANITIGDAAGPGQLDIITSHFFAGTNLSLSGQADAVITGAATIAGTLGIGTAALNLAGTLGAAEADIGAAGTLIATGNAAGSFNVINNAGTLGLFDHATASVLTLTESGFLRLGGTSTLNVQAGTITAGTISIGPDALLDATALTQAGGSILLAGTLLTQNPFAASGVINLSGGTLNAPAITNATIAGYGAVEGSISGGRIIATGPLTIGDDVTAAITIAASAALDLVHAVTGNINFTGAGAELTLNDLACVTASVTNMLDHDAIDLIGIAPSLVSFAAGSLSAGALGGFGLSIATGTLNIGRDNFGGTLLTINGDMPCFARGTRLLTLNGYRPVEFFAPGDPIITLDGATRAVRWIGRRTLDLALDPRATPVTFAAGALGVGIPARPVKLSPLHGVFLAGVLVPAMHLVNGATITQNQTCAATYYHVELDRHDVILADGMAAETYLDTGNRGALYQERGRRGTCRISCAPVVTTGPCLAAIRLKLHNIALAAGYTLTYEPGLRGVAGQTSVVPRITKKTGRRIARFRVPQGAAALLLAARTAAPADTDPQSEDRRQIGICLDDAGGGVLGAGFLPRAAGDAGVWMGGSGEILISRERFDITLGIAAVVRSWRPPIDLGGHPP